MLSLRAYDKEDGIMNDFSFSNTNPRLLRAGLIAGIFTMILAKRDPKQSEQEMMKGVGRIATPLVARWEGEQARQTKAQ